MNKMKLFYIVSGVVAVIVALLWVLDYNRLLIRKEIHHSVVADIYVDAQVVGQTTVTFDGIYHGSLTNYNNNPKTADMYEGIVQVDALPQTGESDVIARLYWYKSFYEGNPFLEPTLYNIIQYVDATTGEDIDGMALTFGGTRDLKEFMIEFEAIAVATSEETYNAYAGLYGGNILPTDFTSYKRNTQKSNTVSQK